MSKDIIFHFIFLTLTYFEIYPNSFVFWYKLCVRNWAKVFKAGTPLPSCHLMILPGTHMTFDSLPVMLARADRQT
jgi:hypothetical protein